jgi:hypothetical protein
VVEVSPQGAVGSGFNLGLIIGTSGRIIDMTRVVIFNSPADMLDYGFQTDDPEYAAAALYFSALQKPNQLAVGCWDSANESITAALSACRSKITDWYTVLLTGATDYDIRDIAAFVQMTAPAAFQFYTTNSPEVLSNSDVLAAGYETGAISSSQDIHAATSPTFRLAVDADTVTPTWHSITLIPAGLTSGELIAEAMQAAIQVLGGAYAGVTVVYTDGVYVITSGTQGDTSKVRVTVGAINDVAATLKIGAANLAIDTDGTGSTTLYLKTAGLTRSLGQYSSTPYAAASIMGEAMGANTGLANSSCDLAYKLEPGVAPEVLAEGQLGIILSKNCNVYVNYGNKYNLFRQGVATDGTHFDQVIGLDMLVNSIQIAVLNLLTSVSKVPQTEAGIAQIYSVLYQCMMTTLNDGFIAPGVWNGPPVLTLSTGDTLSQGFLIMSQSIASQSEVDRAARKAPPIYIAIKLAGAIEFVVVQVNTNL